MSVAVAVRCKGGKSGRFARGLRRDGALAAAQPEDGSGAEGQDAEGRGGRSLRRRGRRRQAAERQHLQGGRRQRRAGTGSEPSGVSTPQQARLQACWEPRPERTRLAIFRGGPCLKQRWRIARLTLDRAGRAVFFANKVKLPVYLARSAEAGACAGALICPTQACFACVR